VSLKTLDRKEVPMNKKMLYAKMLEKDITREQLCEDIKMNKATFSRKCNGHSEFTLGEINKICSLLGVSPMGIFFEEKVS